jgi:hypothetical protein
VPYMFSHHLVAKREFDEKGFIRQDDKKYEQSIVEIGMILLATPLIRPKLAEFIQSIKEKLGFVWTEDIQPIFESLPEDKKSLEVLKGVLSRKLVDLPLIDIGPIRNIRFNALGNKWHIQFANNSLVIPIGEEFVSFLQIVLTEIARSDRAILQTGKEIYILVQEGHFQRDTTGDSKWIVTIPHFDSNEEPDIQKHYSYIGALVRAILQSISNLSKNEFWQYYLQHLLAKENLDDKAMSASSYQRILRNTIGLSAKTVEQLSAFISIDNTEVPINYREWLSARTKEDEKKD